MRDSNSPLNQLLRKAKIAEKRQGEEDANAEAEMDALVAQLAARTATVRTWGPVTQGTGGQYIRPHHQ